MQSILWFLSLLSFFLLFNTKPMRSNFTCPEISNVKLILLGLHKSHLTIPDFKRAFWSRRTYESRPLTLHRSWQLLYFFFLFFSNCFSYTNSLQSFLFIGSPLFHNTPYTMTGCWIHMKTAFHRVKVTSKLWIHSCSLFRHDNQLKSSFIKVHSTMQRTSRLRQT